jgi:hypothetical protein
MAKLLQVSREKAAKGRKKLEELLAEDEFWQEEHKRIKQFEAEEKARRDTEHADRKKSAQALEEVSK